MAIGWAISLIGFAFAAVVATGAELTRLAVMMPPLALGAMICVVFGPQRKDLWVLLVVALVSAYLLVRGNLSPVWDLARRDLFLITAGLLGYLAASSALRSRSGRWMFLLTLSLLVLGNSVVAFHQWQVDEEFAFLRSRRPDTLGVSGFYFHRNYLAGFLEIACPLLLAACLSRRTWGARALLAAPLACGVFFCFLTNSRGGFGAMVLACLAVCVMESIRAPKPSPRTTRRRVLKPLVVLVLLGGLVLVARFSWLAIFENRGGAGAAEGNVMGRLRMAGIAFDIWQESPIWGMGAESYSYLFPRFASGIGGWFGDAEMAHSDYLQLLTDYGLVGLVSVTLLIALMSFLILKRPESFGEKNAELTSASLGGGVWLRSAAVGVMIAEVLRAAIDFNLHIAPNLIAFAIVIAGGVSAFSRLPVAQTATEKPKSILPLASRLLALALALGAGGYGVRAGWNEILGARDWAAIEMMRQRNEDNRAALRAYAEEAPSFRILRSLAQSSLEQALVTGTEEDYLRASEDWRKAVERHPYDGESLTNYAHCLDEQKLFETAEGFHARALSAVGRRENKYGVLHSFGWHLTRRANELARTRQPEKALFLYLKAREAFQESSHKGYSRREQNRTALQWVGERIKFLEGARIGPEEVDALDWQSKLL